MHPARKFVLVGPKRILTWSAHTLSPVDPCRTTRRRRCPRMELVLLLERSRQGYSSAIALEPGLQTPEVGRAA
jgi:hypothetical protein